MTTLTYTWKVEELPPDRCPGPGRWVLVHESNDHYVDEQTFGPMPGDVAEPFVRARRSFTYRKQVESGNIKIFDPPPGVN